MAYGMSGRVFHAPFIYAHPGFELSAVVERHEKKAAERYPGIISYNQTADLMNDQKIELIIVWSKQRWNFLHLVTGIGKRPHASSIPCRRLCPSARSFWDHYRRTGD